MIAGMTYYELLWYFCLYAFLGWVLEVAYHGVTLGKVVNRGFLNGPVCPVYGFGMVGVLLLGKAVEGMERGISVMTGDDLKSLLLLYLGGIVLTTAVELFGGWLLDVLFHTRWWDYSNEPLNFHGYICLKFSMIWGFAVVFVVRIIQPLVEGQTITLIPEKYGWPLLFIFYAAFAVDLVVTVLTVIGLNKKLEELDKLRTSMRLPSDLLSEKVGAASISAAQYVQEGKVQAALAKAELRDSAAEKREEFTAMKNEKMAEAQRIKEELESKFAKQKKDLLSHRHFGAGRLFRAFPYMQSRRYQDVIEELRALARDFYDF